MVADAVELIKVKELLRKINKLAPEMRKMSDDQLKNQTQIFREKIRKGKSLNALLPEAYAAMREADYRVLGEFPYDVQVMGAIVLNQGAIAEMRTGEGKTLTATMPMYLNALEGKGAILVTTNEYLSARDEETLRPVYEWMGLSVSLAFQPSTSNKEATPELKRKWYSADVIYTTASSLAFDYLFNNLATSTDKQYLRPYNYALIDEVDDVLLDEAQSPFVVSSSPTLQSNLYSLADNFVRYLIADEDYRTRPNEQVFWLTYYGVKKAEKYFRINNLFAEENREIYRHIILALRAHLYMRNGHDYMVIQGQVILLDEQDGRLKKGVQIGTGLHQAIEAKEHVALTSIQKTAASITFSGLFGLFNKVSGMSGTVKVNQNEFLDVYHMKVIRIPTRKPVIRKDYPSQIFLTTSDKLLAAIEKTVELHNTGRPVLLITGSVENSEIVSELLLNRGIAHNVLNAFNVAKEAQIIKEAGQDGAVTVATNMAGRGTDIKLGPGVKEKGGLAVIGTEMLPERVKLQLAGRAGRQGDPGTSQFYVSLEDKYISAASTKRQKRYYHRLLRKKKAGKDIVDIHNPAVRLSLIMLQGRMESKSSMSRMLTNKYAKTLSMQREIFYQERNTIMQTKYLSKMISKILNEVLDSYVEQERKWSSDKVKKLVNTHFSYDSIEIPDNLTRKKQVKTFLKELSEKIIAQKQKVLINDKQLNMFYHQIILSSLDKCWIDQVDFINKLSGYAEQWKYSGRPQDYIYEKKAYDAFLAMRKRSKFMIIDNLLLSSIYSNDKGQLIVKFN